MTHRARLLSIFCAMLLLPIVANAMLGENVEVVGIAYDNSVITKCVVDGSFTYAISSIALYVFDTTDPANPIPYSTVPLPGAAYCVELVGDYVYVGLAESILIYTKTNSLYRKPQFVNSFDLNQVFTPISGTLVLTGPDNNTLCLLDYPDGLTFYDVTQPEAPVLIGEYQNTDYELTGRLNLDGNLLVTARGSDESSKLLYYNVSNPIDPQLITSIELPWRGGMQVEGERLYLLSLVTVEQFLELPRMLVIDIADPTDMHILGEFAATENAHNMNGCAWTVKNGVAYITNDFMDFQNGRLRVIDLTDPLNIQQIGFHDDISSSSIRLNGSLAYLTYMRVLDISDPSHPVITQDVEAISDEVSHISIHGNYGFVGKWSDDLYVLDLADPLQPEIVASAGLPSTTSVYPHESLLFINNTDVGGLDIVDVSYPCEPVIVDTWDIIATFPRLVTNSISWFKGSWEDPRNFLVDTSDPFHPEIVGENGSAAVWYATQYEEYVIGTDRQSLIVADNSNPLDPVDVWSEALPWGGIWGLQIEGQYAFMILDENHLRSMDLTDPANPIEIQTVEIGLPYSLYSQLLVYDGYAFASNLTELHVFNVADPSNMFEVGWTQISGYAEAMAVTDSGYLYLANRDAVLIYDVSLALGVEEWPGDHTSLSPARFTLSPAYPNPFNAATVFSVTLPAPSQLDLGVFNVTGQRVTTLFHGARPAGQHRFSFDASNLASGVYFLRATAADQFTAMQKVMLVR